MTQRWSVSSLLLLCLHLGIFIGQSSQNDGDIQTPKKAIVELMIVCDKEFTDRFQNNRTKLIDYWALYMRSVDMKFKTIQSLDISFKVTSIHTIQDIKEQPFIENARNSDGLVDSRDAHVKFSDWLYTHHKNITNFDIAILATGAQVTSHERSWTYAESACEITHMGERHYSTIIIRTGATWGYACSVLSRALGLIMGASKYDTSQCKISDYIMKLNVTGPGQYFFPKCSGDMVSKYINSDKASCLLRGHDSTPDILSTATKDLLPPSLKDQCVMVTGNENATVGNNGNDDPCLKTMCFIPNTNETYDLYPIENSPCGIEKFCFRGRCRPQGQVIQNAVFGLCLHSGDRFSGNDYPTLQECPTSPTPLDELVVTDAGPLGTFLSTPYSPLDKPENLEKYLTVENGSLLYKELRFEESGKFSWEILSVENTGEFLLFHRFTNSCAEISGEKGVEINKGCDQNHPGLRWKFLGMTTEIAASKFQRNSGQMDDTEFISGQYKNAEVTDSGPHWILFLLLFILGLILGLGIAYGFQRYKQSRNVLRYSSCDDQFSVSYSNEI